MKMRSSNGHEKIKMKLDKRLSPRTISVSAEISWTGMVSSCQIRWCASYVIDTDTNVAAFTRAGSVPSARTQPERRSCRVSRRGGIRRPWRVAYDLTERLMIWAWTAHRPSSPWGGGVRGRYERASSHSITGGAALHPGFLPLLAQVAAASAARPCRSSLRKTSWGPSASPGRFRRPGNFLKPARKRVPERAAEIVKYGVSRTRSCSRSWRRNQAIRSRNPALIERS